MMRDISVFVIEPDARSRELLRQGLSDYNIDEVATVVASPDDIQVKGGGIIVTFDDKLRIDKNVTYVSKPYKFAQLLSVILNATRSSVVVVETLDIGAFHLDLVQNMISGSFLKAPVKLTDKERDIISLLFKRHPEELSRQDLLNEIWGYGDQIETHTLETHIYRLRQKIEKDASRPTFLVTKENGYALEI